MSKNSIIGIVLVVMVAGGGAYYFSHNVDSDDVNVGLEQAASSNVQASSTASKVVPGSIVVTYTNGGFSPKTLTVKSGTKVTFLNNTTNRMWVASNPHPSHEGYSGTTRNQHCPDTMGISFDQCSIGNSYTFTFAKVGTWAYHNHAADEDGGTIVVTQ